MKNSVKGRAAFQFTPAQSSLKPCENESEVYCVLCCQLIQLKHSNEHIAGHRRLPKGRVTRTSFAPSIADISSEGRITDKISQRATNGGESVLLEGLRD